MAALTTGLVVSARGVPTREGEVPVQRQFFSFPEWRFVELHLNYFVSGGGTSRSRWGDEIPDRSTARG